MNAERLEKIRRSLQRGYSTHFEGPKDTPEERFIVEKFIVQELLRSMKSRDEEKYFDPIRPPSSGDPPDCVVSDHDGNPVAVEVTEFVSRKAIEEKSKKRTGKSMPIGIGSRPRQSRRSIVSSEIGSRPK